MWYLKMFLSKSYSIAIPDSHLILLDVEVFPDIEIIRDSNKGVLMGWGGLLFSNH